jgi:glycosyltransferase involved in cell wall biosynthesis
MVDAARAGISCKAGDSAALAAAVARMADMPAAELAQMGRNGKTYFDMNFARDRVLDHLDAWLAEVTDTNSSASKDTVT